MVEHDEKLRQVLGRLQRAGITLNKEKSVFCQQWVIFLRHELTSGGVKPHPEKVKTVLVMVEPQDKAAARSFLGFVEYLAKFVNNLAEMATPIRQVYKEKVLGKSLSQ